MWLILPQARGRWSRRTVLVGAAYAVAQLSRQNELTALKASGMSIHRILMPIIVTAVAFSFLAAVNREFVVPHLEEKLLPLERVWT